MAIDPTQALAFAVQTHPRIYALLLGSGVSRAAGIPTGWEIVNDLIRKLAATNQEVAEPVPEDWYFNKYGVSANYSKLIEQLAKTPTERQQLLRPYFEATTEQEQLDGLKQPTDVHKAIAKLVRQGFIKLIITTNFDRLIEKALEQEGVAPEVISSKEQLIGAIPLTHIQSRVYKIHGDYLDPAIRNTPDELADYPQEIDKELDRIFDEFGLIVCGWSAEWDVALGNAMQRAPNRRFTTYWTVRDQPTEAATRLINQRKAEVLNISSADEFFQALAEKIESLNEFSRPHPLSTAVAVESLKRYLTSPEQRIRLNDLINEVAEQISQNTAEQNLNLEPNQGLVSNEMKRLESLSSTLLTMAPIAGYWTEDYHFPIWERTLQHLIKRPTWGQVYNAIGLTVANHPARLTFYALAMGAAASERWQFVGRLFMAEIRYQLDNSTATVSAILACLSGANPVGIHWERLLEGMTETAPLGQWFHRTLREPLKPLIPDDDRYDFLFDQVEMLGSLAFAHLERDDRLPTWFPFGTFLLRPRNCQRILDQLRTSITQDGPESPWIKGEVFGRTPHECQEQLSSFKNFFNDTRRIPRRPFLN